MSRALAVGAAAALGGCTLITDSFVTNGFSGDPFPIAVDTHSGAIVIGIREAGIADQIGIIDILSPVTISDPGTGVTPSISYPDLTLLGEAGGTGALSVPRATIVGPQVIELHPCEADECDVGPGAAPVPYEAIIGADALAGDALRLRLADDQIFVLPDIAGDETARTYSCDAVFPSPYRGGGTMIINGTELDFGNRRVTIQACLAPDPVETVPQSLRGADVLLVASTGLAITILSEAAYQRYRDTLEEVPPAVDKLPMDSVFLASGLVFGHRGTITGLALVATSTASPRAPCRQVYSHHMFTARDCAAAPDELDCPCEDGSLFCGAPAIVELAPPGGIDVLIVPDSDPTLQALGTELAPDQPQVDGILGTGAMRSVELDLDYPHDRVLGRCTDATCTTRPELVVETDRTEIQNCIGVPPGGPIF